MAKARWLTGLPAVAQSSVSAALGSASPAYAVHREGGSLAAANPSQHLRARFDRAGLDVQAAGARFGLQLAAAGVGGVLTPLGHVAPSAHANRGASDDVSRPDLARPRRPPRP